MRAVRLCVCVCVRVCVCARAWRRVAGQYRKRETINKAMDCNLLVVTSQVTPPPPSPPPRHPPPPNMLYSQVTLSPLFTPASSPPYCLP